MQQAGDYADTLRALGRVLDSEGATEFEVLSHRGFLTVTWDTPISTGSRRSYQGHQLRDLVAEGRVMRRAATAPVGSLVEILRTLGQELDRQHVDLSGIVKDADSFHISGMRDGRHYSVTFQTKELVSLAATRRKERGRGGAATASEAQTALREDSFLGVSLGRPVYTEDGELIGNVVDLRDEQFCVRAPKLKAEYWLPAEAVDRIGARGEVVLRAPSGS